MMSTARMLPGKQGCLVNSVKACCVSLTNCVYQEVEIPSMR